ncbi:MAG TPA: nucleoside triphosphate pyrophosphohydrolase [Paracoccaceae bacterium]|nr:nucleoside triphosphate pyrophosphohydrolase [Paracoccaceae bacterium]
MDAGEPADRPESRERSDRLVHDRSAALPRLREIMRRLRAPDGCPWDREQDFRSIAPYTIEEACEVAEAIEREDWRALRDELGDLLLQVVYHAEIAEERGLFGFDDVARASADKMLRRHPHVFGERPGAAPVPAESVSWEAIKAAERAETGERRDSALDGVPAGMPGLARAAKLTREAAKVGFDWPEAAAVLDKLAEETAELVEARERLSADAVEEEFGDLLFVMANLGRHLGADPEAAVRRTNAKFERRFREVERRLRAAGRAPGEADLAEMDAHWDAVKAEEKAEARRGRRGL